MISRSKLKQLADIRHGETVAFDLPCGSKMAVTRYEGGSPGYYVAIRDVQAFATTDRDDIEAHIEHAADLDMDSYAVGLIVLEKSIPALAQILRSLSKAK